MVQVVKKGLLPIQASVSQKGLSLGILCYLSIKPSMDLFEEMKGFYLIMDNAPIHTTNKREKTQTCLPFSLLPPKHVPIENFWTVVKDKVKQSIFEDISKSNTRITEACNPPFLLVISKHVFGTLQIVLKSIYRMKLFKYFVYKNNTIAL